MKKLLIAMLMATALTSCQTTKFIYRQTPVVHGADTFYTVTRHTIIISRNGDTTYLIKK
ncbi:hypothetical protein [Limnovirga soli]|uniref:hypothetical protein n=1 Tax=Limnovirga soli TaxID=2656915 RepID=UPI0014929054|nr:hypothetical protein [Limnovirga soli]